MAAIQILGIRTFINENKQEKKYDAHFKKQWRAPNIAELFQNLDTHLAKIPKNEHWNLFYTVAVCGEGKREFKHQEVLVFDLDGISLDKLDQYTQLFLGHFNLKENETGIIHSGHGIHFIIALKKHITRSDYFKKNRHHYRALCAQINKLLRDTELPGECDQAVFDPRRILRLPGTMNRKPGREDVPAKLVQKELCPIDFDIKALSGLPDIKDKEQISKDYLRKYPRVDTQAILDGCDFLNWCQSDPNKVNEPQWYAMLSVIGRLENGRRLAHEYSQGHSAYTEEETEAKLDQAMDASGPRMCENIKALWGDCTKCPNFEKVKSPILLRSEGHIATEFTGFHYIPFTANGTPGKPVPDYEGLRLFYERAHPYRGLGGSRMVYTYNGTHYEVMENVFIESFAQDHFNPSPTGARVREFRDLICRTNLSKIDWFEQTTRRKMNFQNGILDLDTGDFLSHSKDFGFRHVLPYDYNPLARAPVFQRMLERITDRDETLINVLAEYIGYCLSNDEPWGQKALVLVGDGANGKSTLMEVVKALAGSNNYSSLTIDDLNKSEYNRQMLDGKLFNYSEETPTKSLIHNSLFKTLVTGGEIQVRSPYKDPYQIRSNGKLIFSCNELPRALDTTYGFYRRLIIVPFLIKFTKGNPDFDPHIKDKLLAELPGIFNLAFSGYRRLRRQGGFTDCELIARTLHEYILETDTVHAWFSENINVCEAWDNGANVSIPELYLRYKTFTEPTGERPLTRTGFIRKLSKIVPHWEQRLTVGKELHGETRKSVRMVRGIEYAEGIGIENPPDTQLRM